jgi:hypothetical protein
MFRKAWYGFLALTGLAVLAAVAFAGPVRRIEKPVPEGRFTRAVRTRIPIRAVGLREIAVIEMTVNPGQLVGDWAVDHSGTSPNDSWETRAVSGDGKTAVDTRYTSPSDTVSTHAITSRPVLDKFSLQNMILRVQNGGVETYRSKPKR